MLVLGSNWAYVTFPGIAFLFSGRARIDTPIPAVEADVVFRNVFESRVIGIVNNGFVHVICEGVVEEMIVIPAAAFIADTPIPKSIVDAPIKSNVLAPIAFVLKKAAPPQPQYPGVQRKPTSGARTQVPGTQ